MANEQQLELSRLALERSRVELERTRLMLDQRRTDIEPLTADAGHSREMAHQYAKAALQSLFLLNGGALIAFPTFAPLMDTAFREQQHLALYSLGSFVAGLVLITLATLMSYFALDAAGQYGHHSINVTRNDYLKSQYPDQYDDESRADRCENKKQADNFRSWFGRFRCAAVCLGLASLARFVLGAFCAAQVLMSPLT